MAIKTVRTSDFSGAESVDGPDSTIKTHKLTVDGKMSGEVDLTTEEYDAFVAFAMKADPSYLRDILTPDPIVVRVRSARGSDEAEEARAWALANGIPVKDRGRVPGEVLAKFAEFKRTQNDAESTDDDGAADAE
jgi:Lsr2